MVLLCTRGDFTAKRPQSGLSEPDSGIDPSLNAISAADVALDSTAANS